MWKSLWKNFVNLVYPLSCLICDVRLNPVSDKPVCQACWSRIEFNLAPFCKICGKHLPAKDQNQALICSQCQRSSYFFKRASSVCLYTGTIKECIHLLKYKRKLLLAKPLGKLMVDFAHRLLDIKAIDIIIPVPLQASKLRQRQFNQASLLSKPLADTFAKEIKENLLVKIKSTPAQVHLSQEKRWKNVQAAFRVRDSRPLKDKNILLVDDVLTTAATANECAKMLAQAGAKSIEVFTLAR